MPAPAGAGGAAHRPEGGFDDDEVATARSAGFRPARLGPRSASHRDRRDRRACGPQSHWGDLAAASRLLSVSAGQVR
jgi:hypothetical protein